MCLTVQVDENSLKDAGYVRADKLAHVTVSMNIVAKMLGVSVNTVMSYVAAGYIPACDGNKISLAEALKLDFKEIHDSYIKSRTPIIRTKKHKRS